MTYGGDPQQVAGVLEGDVLAGKYRVDRVLGAGGMGVVVAAYNLALDTRVALKFLLPSTLSNQEAVARFLREARAAAKIVSEHAARVHDVGTLESGAPYIVMELLDGGDLADWLHQRGPLPVEQAVDFVLQACVAVAEAHGLGIVHRDLKPANLFCVRGSDGQFVVKVLDFGISKLTDAARASDPPGVSVTKTAAIMGSPLYMSPEQMRSSKDVDALTDIWALGVVLFQLLTGTTPFVGEAVAEVAAKVAADPVPPPRSLRPDIPAGLDAVILRCLRKDRQERYPNVAELALALLPFGSKRAKTWVERTAGIIQAAGLSASALAMPPSAQTRQATMFAPASVAPWSGTQRTTGGRKVAIGAVVIAGVVGAAAAFFFILRSHLAASRTTEARKTAAAGLHPTCAADSTRCEGATPQTCTGGAWASRPITAGECGATCTPGSADQCADQTPETCGPAGQWEKGSPCPFACREGRCTGECVPGSAQCSGASAAETCDSNGQWSSPQSCRTGTVCREGACVDSPWRAEGQPGSGQAPTPPPQPRPDCNPNYTIDPQSGAHLFKPQCFADSHRGVAHP